MFDNWDWVDWMKLVGGIAIGGAAAGGVGYTAKKIYDYNKDLDEQERHGWRVGEPFIWVPGHRNIPAPSDPDPHFRVRRGGEYGGPRKSNDPNINLASFFRR